MYFGFASKFQVFSQQAIQPSDSWIKTVPRNTQKGRKKSNLLKRWGILKEGDYSFFITTMSVQTTTYRQLCQYGASSYHARLITQGLTPIRVHKRTYVYPLNTVIAAIRSYLERPRLTEQTRATMQTVLEHLLQQLDNVIVAPFGMSPEERISFYVHQILGDSPHPKFQ